MTKILLSKDTMNYAMSIATNGTVHVNHPHCPAGEDTKSRLYVTVPSNGKLLLCHCFNCGGSGIVRLHRKPVGTHSIVPPEAYSEKEGKFKAAEAVYLDGVELTLDHPTVWPAKYFLDCWEEAKAVEFFGIRETRTRYLIPRGNYPHDVTGYEIRFKDTSDGKVKYLRIVHPDYADDSKLLIYNLTGSRVGVLCEDPISAMKVALAGYAGVSLCGSTLRTDDMHRLLILFDTFVVWLDNDNATVNSERERMSNNLNFYTDRIKVERVFADPKQYDLSLIRSNIERMVS